MHANARAASSSGGELCIRWEQHASTITYTNEAAIETTDPPKVKGEEKNRPENNNKIKKKNI